MNEPKRVTGQHPNECPECEGFGDTEATRPETQTVRGAWNHGARVYDEKLRTVKVGSGCPRCCGTGRLEGEATNV